MSDRAAVEEYLAAFASWDWDRFAGILSDRDLRRVGPFMDVIESKDDYVAFLRQLMPTLANYEVRVDRISEIGPQRFLVELSETFDVAGVRTEYPQADLFEVDTVGKIRGVSIFMKTPGAQPPVEGASADDR
ncbi:MAG TPA: nuclear transport factor 2 family protein [Acidimicrobiales bacterium]